MEPINFLGSNIDLVRPPTLSELECGNLRGRLIPTFNGSKYTTCWKPSDQDIKDITDGKAVVIELSIADYVYAGITTEFVEYPSVAAHRQTIVWVPGAKEQFDIKSLMPIYITFLTLQFPVMSVYVKV